jgi:large subunit ribosomal protein L22
MEVATAKWVRTTARKARLVAALVEGLPVDEAITVLSFTPRAAATDVSKVIKSAAANAEHNYNLDRASLRVKRIEIESASTIKRFRPRAQGRAFSIFKRTAHLRCFVADDLQPRVRRAPSRTTTRARRPAPVAEPQTAQTTEAEATE